MNMDRWQQQRVGKARDELDDFIARGEREIAKLQRQLEEARRIRRQLVSLRDFA